MIRLSRSGNRFSPKERAAFAAAQALCAAVAFSAVLVSCAFAAKSPDSSNLSAQQKGAFAVLQSPSRWIRLPSPRSGQKARTLADGTRQLIEDGVRIEISTTGAVAQAREQLPSSPSVVPLPAWLGGGGFVFFSQLERGTAIWRSASWTSPLRPLAFVQPQVRQVVAGFDRLYLMGDKGRALRAIDAENGRALDLGAVPRASGYASLAFATPWLAAANTDLRGVLLTFDAGLNWHPLGIDDLSVKAATHDNDIELRTNHQRMLIDEQGNVTTLTGQARQESDAADDDADYGSDDDDQSITDQQDDLPPNAPTTQFKDAQHSALSAALLNGFQLDASSAIVARGGLLSQVRLSDGAVLRSKKEAYAPRVDCQAIQIGKDPGFVCGAETQATTLYRYDSHFALTELLRFGEPRKVQAAGEGGVVIHGSCDPNTASSQGTYCTFDGHHTKQVQIASNASTRVALLRDRSLIALQPPTATTAGFITRIQGRHRQRVALDLGTPSEASAALLKTGVWLDPLTEDASGNLFTWVLGDRQFVGVKIDAQGKLQLGELRDDPNRALLNGAVGASLTAGDVGFFTTDHGFHWRSFELPAALGSLDPYSESSAIHGGEPWGCSPLGCALGSWLRIGFGTPQTALTLATQPQLIPPLGQAAPHWAMDCAATGEVRGGLSTHRPERHASQTQLNNGADSSALIESSPWRFFQSIAPPAHAPDDLLLDIGQEDRETQFRAYAFGPQTDAWSSSARWLVRVANHFDLDAPWSTAATRIPWPQPMAAARVFGQESQASAFTDWSVVLDSSGLAALLRINGSNGSELYVLEKDQPVLPVTQPNNFDPRRPVTLARAHGNWFVATEQSGSISLTRLEGRRSSPFARFPLFNQDATQVELVESHELDALALWVKTAEDGWYFYPLDLNSATLQAPTHIAVADLSAVPQSCAAESEGWQVTSDVPLAGLGGSAVNTWLAFAPDLSELRVNRVEARVLASEHGVCLDAVAARLDDSAILPRHVPRQEDATSKPVPVTLTDRATERRFGFRCGR